MGAQADIRKNEEADETMIPTALCVQSGFLTPSFGRELSPEISRISVGIFLSIYPQ